MIFSAIFYLLLLFAAFLYNVLSAAFAHCLLQRFILHRFMPHPFIPHRFMLHPFLLHPFLPVRIRGV